MSPNLRRGPALVPVLGLAGHPRARAQGSEAGEGPPGLSHHAGAAHLQLCPCPSHSVPQLLRASGEGVPKPPPRAGAGNRVFQHVPLTAGTIRALGQVAWLPATCPPLFQALLRMGHRRLLCSPRKIGIPLQGMQTPSRYLARQYSAFAEICKTAGLSHFDRGCGRLPKFFRHLRIGTPVTLVGKKCCFQQSSCTVCPEPLPLPSSTVRAALLMVLVSRPVPQPEHRGFARPRGWARLVLQYQDDYFCLLPANA